MADCTEIRLDTRQGALAGLAWRRDDGPRVLALHGWLDNANSFWPLAPLLEKLDLVALDLPGHGHSDHRHNTARYHFVDYLFNIDAALDALGWDDCHILGHSLGASIAAIYAAGAPERLRSIVLLDAIGPLTAALDTTTDRLRRSLRKNRSGSSGQRRFSSIDEMAEARRSVSDLSESASRLICERAARRDGGHYVWRSDPALNWISALLIAEDQVLELLSHIECPVLAIQVTTGSSWVSQEKTVVRKAALANARYLRVDGTHHLHMEQPEMIAADVQSFILSQDKPPGPTVGHD